MMDLVSEKSSYMQYLRSTRNLNMISADDLIPWSLTGWVSVVYIRSNRDSTQGNTYFCRYCRESKYTLIVSTRMLEDNKQ